jgi:P2-related tail formation protein
MIPIIKLAKLSILQNTQISNFMKICPFGAKQFHVDGWMDRWTDITKLIVDFRNFVNVPKQGQTQWP